MSLSALIYYAIIVVIILMVGATCILLQKINKNIESILELLDGEFSRKKG